MYVFMSNVPVVRAVYATVLKMSPIQTHTRRYFYTTVFFPKKSF